MDTDLFLKILSVNSTSGSERPMAEMLASLLKTEKNTVETFEVGDGTLNVLAKWGEPKVWFCSHMDTVPPYIPTTVQAVHKGDVLPDGTMVMESDDVLFKGRGTCDAKGQVFSMFEACKALEEAGETGFALLVLAGEETGSFGAKAYNRDCPGGDLVVVGEPTDNHMVSASKGTKRFNVAIDGKACHSGYPELGESAVEKFYRFMEAMHSTAFPVDELLGETTWNIGHLVSDNPQNILSPRLTFTIYFRTTFASDSFVCEKMASMESEDVHIEAFGGDTPMNYYLKEGIPTKTVAFGSDAPQLHKFTRRALCGPGSILVAHTPKEYILLSDIRKAVANYVSIFMAF